MREWLSRDAWAAAVAKGETPRAGLRKTFVTEAIDKAEGDDGRAVYRFVLSTEAVDRERDTIAVDGWKLKAYRQNPVVLWAHDYRQPPLGQAVELPKAKDGKLVAGVRFDSDVHEMARVVEALVARRTLRATSVGFLPVKHQLNDERRGYDFLEQELLEWSIVPVPANPEALAEAKAAGLDLAPIREWAERLLADELGAGFWVARQTLEAVWRQATPTAGSVTVPVDLVTMRTDPVAHGSTTGGPIVPVGKIVPGNVSSDRADEGDGWSAPSLKDFTDQSWGDLSVAERSRIARHYAWAKSMPPDTFGDLKLPHHRPSDGKVVWRGVAAAMGVLLGARGGTDIPGGERRAVYSHLAAHYRAFDKEPPEFAEAEPGREKQEAFEIQTLIFPKRHWDSAEACRRWLADHEFRSDKVDETGTSWRFRQRDPGDFARLRTICLMPGGATPGDERCRIEAVGGPVKVLPEPEDVLAGLAEGHDATGEARFFLDDEEETAITEGEVRELLEVLAVDAAERAILRLTGRVD